LPSLQPRIERKNIEVSTNNNNWGEAGRYPSINLTLDQNNSLSDNVKVAFPTATQGQTGITSIRPGINLNWTIFQGFKANISKDRLEVLQVESEGNAEVVIQNNVQSIVLGYYVAVLENERLKQFQQQLEYSKDRYEFEKVKFDIGSANTSNLLLEEGNYLTDSVNLITQVTVFENAVRNLNFLIGEANIAKIYRFTDSLEQNDVIGTEESLLAQIAGNADLKKIYLSQSVLNFNTQLAKADRYPTVSISAGLNESRQNLDLSNAVFFNGMGFSSGPENPLASVTDSYFANFTLSFNLFNGGRINRAIKNALVQEDIGNIRIERLKATINRDLRNAYKTYQDRKKILVINEQRERIAKRNIEISEARFKGGTINSFDYRVIQNNYLQSSTQKLQSLYNLIDTKVTLLRLTGGLLSEYVR